MPTHAARRQGPWCPTCKAPAGPDCPDTVRGRIAAMVRDRVTHIRLALRPTHKEHR